MARYEDDYADHTQSLDYAHGDERPSNSSAITRLDGGVIGA